MNPFHGQLCAASQAKRWPAQYRYASLNDVDTFCEMRRSFRRIRCRARAYLHKLRQYSLLHTSAIWYSLLLLGYKPVQHVTVLNIVGNCNNG